MVSLRDALQSILSQPTPAALLALQGALLTSGCTGERFEGALDLAGRFHAYLCELESKITAQEYSELASRLDMGAVGLVAVENLVAGEKEKLWERMLLGFLGEGLMVAASRQYIRAWHAETNLVHRTAAWHLAGALWRLSSDLRPSLSPEERWQAVQSLLAPAHDPAVAEPQKALLLGRLFQVLLIVTVMELLPGAEVGS